MRPKHLLLLLLALWVTIPTRAYNARVNGIYYNLSGNEATVTYKTANSASYSGDIYIPSSFSYNGTTYSVRSIGNEAFADCSGLTSITIPNGVTSIGRYAFQHCSGLTSITIPNSVTSIGYWAFSFCSNLTSITVASGNTVYDSRNNCNAIIGTSSNTLISGCKNTIIPNSVTSIAESAFSNCSSLTSITIPNSVTSIGRYAFYQCSGLTSIIIPNNVTSIGDEAFTYCSGLTSIIVASGNTVYDSRNNCNAIIKTSSNTLIAGCENTIIPSSVTSIGDYAFQGRSGLTSISIPNSVTSIGRDAFRGCYHLTSVNIPDGVTSIGVGTFEYCYDLTSITIPNSVVSIGGSAFASCSGLTSINIPNSVTSIAQSAFYSCSGLTSLTVASGNTAYDSRNNCNAIIETSSNTLIAGCKNTIIPNSVTNIGDYAFYGRSGLTSITIPNSVTSIGETAFYGCYALTSVAVENPTPVTISSNVFSNRTHATLYVPAGSKEAYQAADYWKEFQTIKSSGDTFTASLSSDNGTVSLTFKITEINPLKVEVSTCPAGLSGTLAIPATVQDDEGRSYAVTGIGAEAFKEQAGLTGITLPEGLTTIGDNAFQGTGLSTINLPSTLTSIGQEAFRMSDLSTIVIPDGVTSIGTSAFRECLNLQSATLGSGVTSIGSAAFYDCSELTSVTAWMTTPVPITSNVFSNRANATLQVPMGSEEAYAQANNWKNFRSIGEIIDFADANVKAICVANWDTDGDGELSVAEATAVTDLGVVFQSKSSITSFDELQYFTGLTSIRDYAFVYCSHLTSITIPHSVTSIGYDAFGGCSGLTSISIPNSVTSIGEAAFSSCSGLTSITVASDNTVYDSRNNCNAIIETSSNTLISGCKNTIIPNSVTSIGGSAFYGFSGLTSISIPNSVTSIGQSAFAGSGLTSITIPNSVTSIRNSAFSRCSGLTSITIPNSVTSIGSSSFYDCDGLTSISIPNSVTSIGEAAFSGCSGLTSITVASDNTVYDSRNNCNAIIETSSNTLIAGCKNTIIPNSVTSIGNQAFAYFYELTSISIPNSVTSIGNRAFYDCYGLTSITIPNSVTNLGNSAFYNCHGLTSITIPNSVTSIGETAFQACSGLTTMVVMACTPASCGANLLSGTPSDLIIYVPNKSLDTYKTTNGWSTYAERIQPFYTLTYQAVYNGEVVKSATADAFPGDAIPAIPEELNHDFVTLTLDGTMPASVSDDHVLNYNAQWNGPFQIATSEADATWYNLKIRWNKYLHVNETEPYYSNANVTPRELAQAEYQWAFGGNPYEVILYNRSTGFSKSMTPANGFADRSPVVLRDGTYKWDIGQMYYDLGDGTSRPDFLLQAKDGSSTAFMNDFAEKELALWVSSNYWDEGNRIIIEPAPSPNWISGEHVNCIAGNKVTIPLSLDNLDDIAGVQFELSVPAGMTLKKATVTSRSSAFSASFALASEGVYTLLLIQKTIGETIATIDGHEGVFLNLELESEESMQLGNYTITYSDIVLTKADGNTVSTVDNTSDVTIVEPEPGDANRDGKVNVADIVAVANHILHNTPAKFSFDAANVNGDSTVNVADIVGIANIIINAARENQVKAMGGKMQELDPQ